MKTNSTPCLRNTWKSPKRTNDEAPGRSSARKGFACLCSRWLFIRLSAGQIPRSVRRISLIYRCMQSGAHRPRMGMRAYLPLICAHSQSDAQPDSMGNARLAYGQGFLFPGKPRAARIAFPRPAPRVISAAGQIPSAQCARSPRRSFHSPSDRKAGLHPSPMPPLCNDFTPSQSTILRIGGIIMQL